MRPASALDRPVLALPPMRETERVMSMAGSTPRANSGGVEMNLPVGDRDQVGGDGGDLALFGFGDRQRGHVAATTRHGEPGGAPEQPRMEVEDVNG